MPKILIINLNLEAGEGAGCARIADALHCLSRPGREIATRHFAQVRADPSGCLRGVASVVLGPQGMPFTAYDANFLPWLRQFVATFQGPILGVCGGMQALGVAHGGQIAPAFGQTLGIDYSGLRKIAGPLAVDLDVAALPAWLPPGLARNWQEAGARVYQSHVEQLTTLPTPWRTVAHSAPTPIEAFAHPERPILASQFHPERGWDHGCDAGRLWLETWLQLLD